MNRRRLGEILVSSGELTERQLEDALAEQANTPSRERLGATVRRLGLADDEAIRDALADQLGLGTVDLTQETPEQSAVDRVSRRMAQRHEALPLRIVDDELIVAMADPTDVVAIDDLRLSTGLRDVRPVVATEEEIAEAIRRTYGGDAAEAQAAIESMGEDNLVTLDEAVSDIAEGQHQADDAPVIRLTNALLAEAVRSRASDVHIEPERTEVRVRYRIDGLLREAMHVPRGIGPALTSRIKIMASMDIAERRRPQDGRAMVRIGDQEVDLRVSSMPTLFGETLVLRLLRKGEQRLTLDDVGLPEDINSLFERILRRPQGLIVITGPTGSGKTTTLYAALQEIQDPVRNILTLEDPIEYQLPGINQTQINPKVGLTFARGMRTVVRQDPDVVMVGEIRDEETAELALEASMTGHLVLSTLHTNDAPSTIVRLTDLDVDRFMIASSLAMAAAQRLARRVCPHCVREDQPTERTLRLLGLSREELAGKDLRRGEGCTACDQTGYLGRTAILEALPVTPSMRDLIMEGGGESALARLAREQGMRTLREEGLRKAYAGETTLEEVLRVTPEESVHVRRCPECETLVGEDFVICPNCETTLGHMAATCSTCRRPVQPGWSACPYCRSALDGGAAAEAPPARTPARAEEEASPDAPSSSMPGRRASGRIRVLVVDDDASIRRLLRVQLEDHYEVHTAATGDEALERHEELTPEVLILDYRLPDLDGLEITERIRAGGAAPDTRILMITGVDDRTIEVEGLHAGVDDFLTKPLNEGVLRARIAAALRRTSGAPAGD